MDRKPDGLPRRVLRRGLLPLTDRAYGRICALVRAHFGIHLTAEKRALVVNRLHNHIDVLGLPSYEAYIDHVEADASGQALDVLASLISINHTSFFREEAHFEFLRTRALPEVESRLARAGERDLRLWCAAASTGEEAYSIAMTMLDYFGPRYGRFDAGLLATDLSLRALRHASAGVYTDEQVRRVPPDLRRRYVLPRGDGRWAVAPEVRAEVLFRKFNLTAAHYPFKRPFHLIFCRNVMIYFDRATREKLVQRYWELLRPGGLFFVGLSESLTALNHQFEYVQPAVYVKPAGSARPA